MCEIFMIIIVAVVGFLYDFQCFSRCALLNAKFKWQQQQQQQQAAIRHLVN